MFRFPDGHPDILKNCSAKTVIGTISTNRASYIKIYIWLKCINTNNSNIQTDLLYVYRAGYISRFLYFCSRNTTKTKYNFLCKLTIILTLFYSEFNIVCRMPRKRKLALVEWDLLIKKLFLTKNTF